MGTRRIKTAYIFRLRQRVKVLAGEVRCVLQLLPLRLGFLAIVFKSREDEEYSFDECNAVCPANGGSQTMLGPLSDAF